jgi:hypothetical protein
MKKEELAPGIILYSDVIPGYENIIDQVEDSTSLGTITWGSAQIHSDHKDKDGVLNKNTRDTSVIGVPYKKDLLDGLPYPGSAFNAILSNLFFDNFDPLEKDYISSYGSIIDWHDSYGILKYGKGQKFINHIDDSPAATRRISTVYYLNDKYSGGEINFPRFNVRLKPKANQMIVFPSSFVYNHSVDPVIEGTRYAVVSWLR